MKEIFTFLCSSFGIIGEVLLSISWRTHKPVLPSHFTYYCQDRWCGSWICSLQSFLNQDLSVVNNFHLSKPFLCFWNKTKLCVGPRPQFARPSVKIMLQVLDSWIITICVLVVLTCGCKCFTCVTKTIANLTTYSRKPGDYNGTIIFEIDIIKNSSPLNLIFTSFAMTKPK